MLNNKKLLTIVFTIVLAVPFMMAATTMNLPANKANVTSPMTLNCTTAILEALNATVYYNASGGISQALTGGVLTNGSAADTDFTGSITTSSLTDGADYNMTCYTCNASVCDGFAVNKSITIDNTDPAVSLTLLKSKLTENRVQELTWATSDVTTGLLSTKVGITTPNAEECAIQNWTDTSKTSEQFITTKCVGTYTVRVVSTDYAGNSGSSTSTFKVTHAGGALGSGSGSSSASAGTFSLFGGGDSKINTKAIVIIIAIIAGFYLLRKK